jgi:predicted small secreted protein
MSSKSLIGVGIGLAAVIVVAVFLYSSNNERSTAPLTAQPNATQVTPTNATQAAPLNTTQVTSTVHHYQVKINEIVSVGERT